MYGHYAIWDFSQYATKDLKKMQRAYRILQSVGVEQDDDMMMELEEEIDSRKRENQ